jgi:hypothetical protein
VPFELAHARTDPSVLVAAYVMPVAVAAMANPAAASATTDPMRM